MSRFVPLFCVLLACTPGTDRDTPAPAAPSDTVAFHLAWPEGRAVVTQTRRTVGVDDEDSTLSTRWTLTASRSSDALIVESGDHEVVTFEGNVGRFQVVDALGMMGKFSVDARSGKVTEIGGFEPLGEHLRAIERTRHSDPNDEGHEFRARLLAAVVGSEQLHTATRSSWAVLVGNLAGKTISLTGEEPRRSKKTLAYGSGVVVETVVERSVEVGVPCGDQGPRSCVRVHSRTRAADPKAAMASLARAMDSAAGDEAASSELGDAEFVGEWDHELVCDPNTLRPYAWRMRDRAGIVNGSKPLVNQTELSLTFDWK